jgi:pimeloyl-ACP methyl ester carboxylesterase
LTPADEAWINSRPEDFYAVPDAAPALTYHKTRLPGEDFYDRFTFPSVYQSPYPVNNTVYGQARLHRRDGARAALIIVHGHGMTTFNLLKYYARPALRLGVDVYFIALPYHMQRAPAGTWSGQYSLNADVRGSAMAFKQGVQDVRSLMNWIERERHTPIILAGVSLGAFTCAMTVVVDDRPKAVISIIGGGSLAQIVEDGYQSGRSKRQLRAGGISAAELERCWALLGPGNWRPKVSSGRVLMIAGKYDPIVRPSNVGRLWQAWNKPRLHWYPAGHSSIATYHHPLRDEITRLIDICL